MLRTWMSILALLPLLAACSTASERPDPYTLPQYAEADPLCRDVSGRYRAAPQPFGQVREERPLLAHTLLSAEVELSQVTQVELALSAAGEMQVLAFDANGGLVAKQRHRADSGVFECDSGQLLFYPEQLPRRGEGVPWNKVVLRKTVDGSLMLRKGGLFSGLVFLVAPMTFSTEDWYLFKPAP